MKSAVSSLGGALAMLLVIAAWQARTTALSFAAPGSVPGFVGLQAPLMPAGYPGGTSGFVPVSYQGAVPMAYQGQASNLVALDAPRAVPVRYVVDQPAPRRVVVRETRSRRSWVKTALVIGGSAGAGAGVGAIAGGKKGALIGAAIGGGAASLFEALKR